MIWRLLFRMTAVAVLVSIVPFTIDDDDLSQEVRDRVDLLPALAFALVAVSWLVLLFEFSLFKPINDAYVAAKGRHPDRRHPQPSRVRLGGPP